MDRQSTRQFLFTLAILGVSLIFFSPFITISMAQSESVGAPSAIPYYEAEEEAFFRDLAIPGAGAVGGTDVSLSSTNGPNEPAVAVNPTNSNNVIVAKLFGLRISTDGGATFGAEINAFVPTTHVLCGDGSVAFDSTGRLFWTYLGCFRNPTPPPALTFGIDAFVAQVNPTTGAFINLPVNVTAAAGVPGSANNGNDKQWIAVDRWAGSPFQDRIYLVWTNFLPPNGEYNALQTSFSTDQGATWSAAVTRSLGAEGFTWPSHNAVAPNGDVYVAYHSQPTFSGSNPNGTSGQIIVLRSTDGGATFPQRTAAFTAGNADITFNRPGRRLNQNVSWTQGSAQPWVLPDPLNPNNVYVVAADDPTNTTHGGTSDDMNVYIVRSTNSGATWSAPAQINTGALGTTQFFPTAAIDDQTGCIVVNWYDTRNGVVNGSNNFFLDVFTTVSSDGGLTFAPETQINDVAFDPDLGATDRFPPDNVRRIGEYIGVAVANGVAHSVWTGNTATGQQIVYENSPVVCVVNQPPVAQCQDVTVGTDPGVCTAASASVDNGSSDPDGDPITLVQAPAGPYPKGPTPVTLTVTDDHLASDSCTATVTVVDREPPALTCPAPQNVECTGSGSAVATYSAILTDNCGIASLGCVPPSGSSFPLGTTAVICNATDASGNSSSCSSSVAVVDSIAPTVMCVQSVNPSDKNVPKASNEDGFYKVSASDICTTPVIKIGSFTLASGETIKITQTPGKSGVRLVGTMGKPAIKHFQVGPNDAVITATDGSGNQASVTCLVPPPPK